MRAVRELLVCPVSAGAHAHLRHGEVVADDAGRATLPSGRWVDTHRPGQLVRFVYCEARTADLAQPTLPCAFEAAHGGEHELLSQA